MPGCAGRYLLYFQFKPRVKRRRLKRMTSRRSGWALVCFVLAASASAQFTDPRNYEDFPVGVNQIELAYAYVRADTSIDTSIAVAGAHLNLNQGTIAYTRYFGLFSHMAWFSPSIPLAGLGGSVSGTNVSQSIAGAGDTSYEFAFLLKGGPALSVAEYANYKPATVVGTSLSVTAPTGLYSPDRILNLGSDRWSFKPEIAYSHPFGPGQKWTVDAYANCYFYTENPSYRGSLILRQGPLPAVEGHISYLFFHESLMASLDARASFMGNTSLNGIGQNDSQRNFILGTEEIYSLNNQNQFTFVFESALVHVNGVPVRGFAVRYDYFWGRGYK
jgi:hypothetical protein